MGSMTLTGPAASFDRSTPQSFSWTWAQTRTNEQLQRWRVQYRTVGSGTWLNGVDNIDTQLLANGQAESANGWHTSAAGFSAQLTPGARVAGSNCMLTTLVDASRWSGSAATGWIRYPNTDFKDDFQVTPGARYLVNAWFYTDNIPSGYDVWASIQWLDGNGTYLSQTSSSDMDNTQHIWSNVPIEGVAPAGATRARILAYFQTPIGTGYRMFTDDWTAERLDTSTRQMMLATTTQDWAYKFSGPPQPGSLYVPASYWTAGNWEARVEYVTGGPNNVQQTFYSNTVNFTAVTAPTAPNITTPSEGGTIVAASSNVVFTHASGQSNVQVRVMNGAEVMWDSGTVAISTGATSSTVSAQFPTNLVPRQVQARTQISGVWSSWATRNVNVDWTKPAVPTVTAVAQDESSFGSTHAVRITVTNPTPTGSQPTVTTYTAWWRRVGETTERLIGGAAAGQPLVWHSPPSGIPVQVRVLVSAANGTQTYSTWVTVSGTVSVRGVILYDPDDPSGTDANFRLNGDGVDEAFEIESALLTISGREYPIVEYGPGTSRTLEVPELALRTDAEIATLRALLTRRSALVYRDKRGRAVLGRVSVGKIADTTYGYSLSLSVDVLDSWGA